MDAVDRLTVKLASRVYVRPHVRATEHGVTHVEGHMRRLLELFQIPDTRKNRSDMRDLLERQGPMRAERTLRSIHRNRVIVGGPPGTVERLNALRGARDPEGGVTVRADVEPHGFVEPRSKVQKISRQEGTRKALTRVQARVLLRKHGIEASPNRLEATEALIDQRGMDAADETLASSVRDLPTRPAADYEAAVAESERILSEAVEVPEGGSTGATTRRVRAASLGTPLGTPESGYVDVKADILEDPAMLRAAQKMSAIRDRYLKAKERSDRIREEHNRKYGAPGGRFGRVSHSSWLNQTERKRLDAADNAMRREEEKMMALLDEISPQERQWRSGVPLWWIMEKLTFDDATTRGALSVVPPVSYGSTEQHSREFARALR